MVCNSVGGVSYPRCRVVLKPWLVRTTWCVHYPTMLRTRGRSSVLLLKGAS